MNPKNNNSKTLPALLVGFGLVGGSMFLLGRSLSPTTPTPTQNAEESHGEESHTDEEKPEEGGHEEHGEESIRFTPEGLKSAGVQLASVSLQPQLSGLPFNGAIEVSPDRVARVASVVSGRITRLNARIGSRVNKGDVLALIESRSVGEAQSAYRQAVARLQNAVSNADVVRRQTRAGVFSQAPLEAARRARSEAVAEVRAGETAVRAAETALENVTRLAGAGSYARPALEASRGQYATAREEVELAQAALANAEAAVKSATAELARRRGVASSGGYSSRPVEEAKRVLVAAQSARATAQSEVSTTRANLARARSLGAEGLVATRDLEAAQSAFETAQARLETAGSDERTAAQEVERQQKLAGANLNGNAEVGEAQARLASAEADVRTRRAQLQRAREGVRLAEGALNRERSVYSGGIANRREVSQARATLENAKTARVKAVQALAVTSEVLRREESIFRQNLNNTAQKQAANATLVAARSDVEAAQTALRLLKSAPGGSAVLPLRAPLSGVVQARDVMLGESVAAEANLFTVANLDVVHVDMFLPERDIAKVRVGTAVKITVDALPNRSFMGSIELIHSELDPKTRTVEAHAEIPNPGGLRPGMFARGTIGTGDSKLGILVPTDAVQDMEGKKVVFVAGEKAGEFEAREVDAAAPTGGRVLVRSGLRPDERVVVKGAFMVKAQAMKAELGHEH
jgi:cobalt-zinc-cadmium efflux system membrane fusion protein